ncbi:ATP-dependent RecD-like DNA helicase [Gimesia fumaroli]|uniref:ATP-dependent RecD-like DNA helicase n=2 Tax=Gimesia fumaroli TaxID=2527976 RepID=A0A518IIZ5_9PLAN|nr:ATP-dependent RecD-like DNA helicase [Gimesia fumaroli]
MKPITKMEISAQNQDDDSPSVNPPQQIGIRADLDLCLNYASWQNSVPFLKALEIHNHSSEMMSDLVLEMQTEPPFARPKQWHFERIAPGTSIKVNDTLIDLDPAYLNGLNEAERGQVRFSLQQGERVLEERLDDVRVLARDEWGGFYAMADLLAAFVMPNDPAIARILKAAGEILAQHGHSAALDGYQQQDPARAFMQGAAIWSAIAAEGLTYTNPPKSFETVGQKTRRPAQILNDGLATCLDSSLLFAAALEAIGLNPVLILVEGHSFVGFWVIERTFHHLIETDSAEIRKGLAARELITFETTLVTHRPPSPFEAAIAAAKLRTLESVSDEFVAAIDVNRARMGQIRPLASHEDSQIKEVPPHTGNVAIPLPAMPAPGELALDFSEETPKTPEGRIERWQRKLLDLSLRNRLLNFRSTKQTVPFFCPDVPLLEDRLANQSSIRVISLPEQNPLGERDAKLHFQKTGQDIHTEFAVSALERNEISSPLPRMELDARLTNLYRIARNDLAEGGTNTLFLAVGFLKWKRTPEDARSYRAPLLLIPVKLTRKSVLSQFHLRHHEDDVRFNATLIQLLKKDFDRDISHFEADLPQDESGIDVPLVLDQMRRAVRDIPGFEVIDEIALSTFSFSKYLMWKDLVDRTAHLEENRVVRHLIRDPDKPFESDTTTAIPAPQDIDRKYIPTQLIHPLAADSSQLAAIMAAAEGHDFVLIGPPGTGKSQTISNMIAQCLANGKTVLFVAEKTAALDVVYRRLCQNGLGDVCLELHSHSAERKQFYSQLQKAWKASGKTDPSEWIKVNDRLKIKRDELNHYVAALHELDASGWTVYRGMGVSVKYRSLEAPLLDWDDSVQIDEQKWEALENIIDEIALTFRTITPNPALNSIRTTNWSASWEANLLRTIDTVIPAVAALESPLRNFVSAIGLEESDDYSLELYQRLRMLAGTLQEAAREKLRIIFDKDFSSLADQARKLKKDITAYQIAQSAISATYEPESLISIPVDDLDFQWRQAKSSFWPISFFAKRKVQKLLQTYAASGVSDPEKDLSQIRLMQKYLTNITNNALANRTPHWNGLQTEVGELTSFLQRAQEIRQTIVDFGQATDSLKLISSRLAPVIIDDSTDHPLLEAAQALLDANQAFIQSCTAFREIAGGNLFHKEEPRLINSTLATLESIKANRTELKRWVAWSAMKQQAQNNDLDQFVEALETQQITPEGLRQTFEVSFVRWWLPQAIDRSDTLRQFQRFKHEDTIEDFRRLDQLARTESATQVRNQVTHDLPKPDQVPRKSELGLLRHQMNLKRPSKAIREVISGMPETFARLAPCLLMSPLSIAQYLPPEQALFDVIIFDEASQITTWDAIGAIARGRQTIIVGDPKQLPPTNFFGRADDDEENEELEDYDRDLESILDEATASGLPLLQLNWHYRSQHESLIAFSNWNYYENNLITFPSAVTDDRAVSLKHLPEAIYDRGKSRTNRIEAETLVADAVERMKSWLSLAEDERPTLGVITFNSQQQTLIQDLFDQSLREAPELEWYFDDARIEPTIVKNLENVQGDERDVMLFSITNGPDEAHREAGHVSLNFGALNRQGGERRLNVAVTRARQELIVYVSFLPDQLKAERTTYQGVRDLKAFLEYAQKGKSILGANTGDAGHEFESLFEEAVASALTTKGWQIVPQVGVSAFRVDLGIVHPDKPGSFLAGIECDGAAYHRAATARDRDKIREQVLRNLGWEILRVWSPDWWYDSQGALDTIDLRLQELLENSRSEDTALDDAESTNLIVEPRAP